jgi:hypothetical protein
VLGEVRIDFHLPDGLKLPEAELRGPRKQPAMRSLCLFKASSQKKNAENLKEYRILMPFEKQ